MDRSSEKYANQWITPLFWLWTTTKSIWHSKFYHKKYFSTKPVQKPWTVNRACSSVLMWQSQCVRCKYKHSNWQPETRVFLPVRKKKLFSMNVLGTRDHSLNQSIDKYIEIKWVRERDRKTKFNETEIVQFLYAQHQNECRSSLILISNGVQPCIYIYLI